MEKTFKYENELPSLPVPELNDTMPKLLEWIKPVANEGQFRQTRKVVKEFLSKNGEGQKLQKELQEWDKKIDGSWLKPFWDDMYLEYRGSLPTNMNFCILLDNKEYKDKYKKAELAGKASYLATELYHMIVDEEYEPETIKGTPLCMVQYKNLFKSIRIPRLGKDKYKFEEFDKKNNHIVLLYKNNVYKVSVTDGEGNIYLSKDIGDAIKEILKTEDSQGDNIGIITTAERDEAAKIYDKIVVSKVNEENIKVIGESLLVISIDDESNNSQETIENLFANGNNKYFDKTIQLIINNIGEVGINSEHTGIDGTTVFSIVNHVNEGLGKNDTGVTKATDSPKILKLEWEVTEEIKEDLKMLQKNNLQAQKNYSLDLRIFKDFGHDEIKKMKISPDAFFHIALQLAQYRTFGTMRSTYEPVAVRFFKEGRTECARSSSMEKLGLIKALEAGENKETIYSLMQKASDAHSNRLKECQKGYGVERHMYGLQKMYNINGKELGMKEVPEIFRDKGYLNLRHDFISTSGMPNKNIKHYVFGPVVEGGFGICYIITNDKISISLSSKSEDKVNEKKLGDNLIEALKELRDIAESNL